MGEKGDFEDVGRTGALDGLTCRRPGLVRRTGLEGRPVPADRILVHGRAAEVLLLLDRADLARTSVRGCH